MTEVEKTAWLAENIMGWHKHYPDKTECPDIWFWVDDDGPHVGWHPYENPNHVWMIIEKARKEYLIADGTGADTTHFPYWKLREWIRWNYYDLFEMTAQEAATAISDVVFETAGGKK